MKRETLLEMMNFKKICGKGGNKQAEHRWQMEMEKVTSQVETNITQKHVKNNAEKVNLSFEPKTKVVENKREKSTS